MPFGSGVDGQWGGVQVLYSSLRCFTADGKRQRTGIKYKVRPALPHSLFVRCALMLPIVLTASLFAKLNSLGSGMAQENF